MSVQSFCTCLYSKGGLFSGVGCFFPPPFPNEAFI